MDYLIIVDSRTPKESLVVGMGVAGWLLSRDLLLSVKGRSELIVSLFGLPPGYRIPSSLNGVSCEVEP